MNKEQVKELIFYILLGIAILCIFLMFTYNTQPNQLRLSYKDTILKDTILIDSISKFLKEDSIEYEETQSKLLMENGETL